MVLFSAINRCLESWNVREKEFKHKAKAKLVGTVGAKLITMIYGIISRGNPLGFILGDLVVKPITSVSLLSAKIRRNSAAVLNVSINELFEAAKEYRSYPLYNLPANTLITLGTQLPVYLLSLYFAPATTGYYSLAVSMINAPTQILGLSFAQVFFQKANETFQLNATELPMITRKFFKRLLYVAVLPFALIAVFGDVIFQVVFGTNWEIAGEFASYLSIMAYMNFISISICSLYRVLRLEKLQFYIILFGASILVAGLTVSITLNSSHYLVLIYSLVNALLQIALIAVILKKIKVSSKLLVQAILLLALVTLVLYIFRMLFL